MRVGGLSQSLVAPSTLLTALSVLLSAPFVSPAKVSDLLFFASVLFSSSLPDLSQIYYLEAFESRFAGLIGLLLLLLLFNVLGWSPEVDDLCRTLTHSDAFGEMEVYRAESPVLVPTRSSGSLVASDGFGLVVCLAVEILLADRFWEIEICVRFCLDLVIVRLSGVDLLVLGRFLAIGASFPGGRFWWRRWVAAVMDTGLPFTC